MVVPLAVVCHGERKSITRPQLHRSISVLESLAPGGLRVRGIRGVLEDDEHEEEEHAKNATDARRAQARIYFSCTDYSIRPFSTE